MMEETVVRTEARVVATVVAGSEPMGRVGTVVPMGRVGREEVAPEICWGREGGRKGWGRGSVMGGRGREMGVSLKWCGRCDVQR